MQAVDIIIKKRDKQVLTKEEIEFFVEGFSNGSITDYQLSAWAMAVLLNGMDARETSDLTMAMVKSGDIVDYSDVIPYAVDKHSTGGVGDKTSLVVVPVVAACGLPVGKMSGRGLGFSGGTLDKLDAVPGFRSDLSQKEFLDQLENIGIVLSGQSADLAPADGKLYAIRDVTGTVPSIPLIASSIMSKKIASGANGIVLDVKVGNGAFMHTLEDARTLSQLMVDIGKRNQREVIAVLSDMNQPLGNAIGNSLELIEAVETLKGNGPEDFRLHCIEIGAWMLLLGKKAANIDAAKELFISSLDSGEGYQKLVELISAQQGDISYLENTDKFPTAEFVETVHAEKEGVIAKVHARSFGEAAVILGAGRSQKGQEIDLSVGFILHKKVGDKVSVNEPLFTIYANDQTKLSLAKNHVNRAVEISTIAEPLPLFYGHIR